MTKGAVVSDEFARKFATEKETPYTRWVRDEGLDIISSFYVPNLHTVELKPWPRRGGCGRGKARGRNGVGSSRPRFPAIAPHERRNPPVLNNPPLFRFCILHTIGGDERQL